MAFRWRKFTRITVLVAARPGHPPTGHFRGPPAVRKAIRYVRGSSPGGVYAQTRLPSTARPCCVLMYPAINPITISSLYSLKCTSPFCRSWYEGPSPVIRWLYATSDWVPATWHGRQTMPTVFQKLVCRPTLSKIPTKVLHRFFSTYLCDCNVTTKYFITINAQSSDPYAILASTLSFINSLQKNLTIIKTKVQHSYLPVEGTFSPYIVVTRYRWNSSISTSKRDQNIPHFPNKSLTKIRAPMCIWNYLLISDCNLILWYCRYLDDLGNTNHTTSWILHNSGMQMDVRGFVEYFTSTKPHIIGCTYLLKAEMMINWSLVFTTFLTWTPSLWDSLVETFPLIKNFR